MKWGDIKEGDVMMEAPIEEGPRMWAIANLRPNPHHDKHIDFLAVCLDSGEETEHTRNETNDIALGYTVLRGTRTVQST